ncbi:KDGP aldolase [Paenibacillaceae bacterium WGS1546]|uniref:KDGP aldolase n=1 Tax=Cohnella sp. WGS1546 TaxID=3366810 RepID=UPI00372D5097
MNDQWFEHGIGGKVLLNIQAYSIESARAATKLLGKSVLIGVMARDYPVLNDGVAYIDQLHREGINVSVGLGDGSAEQWERALQLTLATQPVHLNQIFPAAALSQYAVKQHGASTLVNAMIKPAGQAGFVLLGTGPLSQNSPTSSAIPVEAAVAMMKETGIRSVKYFPIEGCKRLDELRAVARAAARADIALEPTGGIAPDNVEEVVRVCLEEGVTRVMPHLYGSLKNPATNDLDTDKLNQAVDRITRLFERTA